MADPKVTHALVPRAARVACTSLVRALSRGCPLVQARGATAAESNLALNREKELLAKAELLRAQVEREARERHDLQAQLSQAQDTSAKLASENASLKLSPSAERLRLDLDASRREAETLRAQGETAERLKQAAIAESQRERARAETAEQETARVQIRASKGISDAEARRDAVHQEMEVAAKAANRALAEVAEAEKRLEARADFMTRATKREVAELSKQRDFLQEQLTEVRAPTVCCPQGGVQPPLRELLPARRL